MANNLPTSPASSQQIEEYFTAAFHHAEELLRKRWEILEENVRKSPTAAILIAVGVGHCLHRLPLRSILGTQMKLLWALAPPGLLAAAAAKAYHLMEERNASSSHNGDSSESSRGEGQTRRAANTPQQHSA